MSVRQITLLALYTFAVASVFHAGDAEGIRLCGRRLADILNFICERQGGFHVPRVKRDVSDSSKSTHLNLAGSNGQSRVRRSETSEFDGMFAHQGGVVDECCKKQCTLTTLASYCANAQDLGHVNLHDLFPSEARNIIISEEAVAELPQISSSSSGSSTDHQLPPTSHKAHLSRPNLGLSNRDRSVFIVLSQLQADEDKAFGEYRF